MTSHTPPPSGGLPPQQLRPAPARRLLDGARRGARGAVAWAGHQRRHRPLTFASALFAVGLVGVAVAAFASVFVADYRSVQVPPAGEADIASPSVVLDATGEELARLDAGTVGQGVRAADLPDHVVDAVLAAEDRDFWGHGGVSVPGVVRAALANVRSAEVVQGASTITQQYVDLTTSGDGRSLRAKLHEAAAALRYEDELGKAEVLDRYLNVVPFGRDTTGIDQAAKVYFRVPAAELDVNQAATLAGIIAAPSAFDPERNPEDARRRRDLVVEAMASQGWLDRAAADGIVEGPLPTLADEPLVQYGPNAYVVDAVRRTLERELGDRDLSRGLVVHTTIDARMQQVGQAALQTHVAEQPWTGSIVSIDPASGEVRALVGGPDFASQPYNAAVQAHRQPGSSFKPFTLAAFVDAGYAPSASRYHAPPVLEVDSGPEPVQVHNFGDQGFGRINVHDATVNSVNTVYMQMIAEVGPPNVVDLAHGMGITAEVPPVPSIALGTGSVTPLEMASAYATFAAGGVHRTPTLVRSVEGPGGEVLYEAAADERRALSEQAAGVVTGVLQDVVEEGTGTAAQIGRPVAGKTGTTDDSRDAWFVGFAPQLATAVWVGNADNSPMPDATGGGLAAPIWSEYMAQAMDPIPVVELPAASEDGLQGLDAPKPDTPDD